MASDSFQKLVVSRQSLAGQRTMPPERLAWLTTQVNLFFGSFRKADADDPETFHSGCTRLFSAYPDEVVAFVVDPVTGLSGRVEWLPPLAKVKAALDERAFQISQAVERTERERAQLDARKADAERAKHKPTLEELKAKYGPNWGLSPPPKENEEAQNRRRAFQDKANRRIFEGECRAAGMPADSNVSPSLRRLLDEQLGPRPR